MTKRALLSVFAFCFVALVLITCGKKAPPRPPVYILPQPAAETKVFQSGDLLLFAFKIPALSTDYKTPADVHKIEVFRLKEPRVGAEESQAVQAQTAPASPQTQSQSPPQTQSQPQSQPQTQTQPERQEMPRPIPSEEFDERSERIAEISGDQIAAYLRDDYIILTDKVNVSADSADLKTWYYYAVKLYNKKGRVGDFSRPVALFPQVVPKPPTGFKAIVAEKTITFSWNPSTVDVNGKRLPPESVVYNVYRGQSANFAPRQPLNSAPLDTTTFADESFQFGNPYYYFVKASISRQKRENESAPSNAVLVYPQDIFAPAPPQELNAVPAREGMVLIWAPNPEEDVAGYNIYRSEQPGTGYQKINKQLIRETTFTDTDIRIDQPYYYVVTAVDNAPNPNESKYSTEMTETKRHQ